MASNTWKQLAGVALTSLFTLTWFRFKPIYNGDMSLGTTVGHTPPAYLAALLESSLTGLSPQVYPATQGAPTLLLYTYIVNILHTFTPIWFSQFAYIYTLALIAGLGVCALLGRISNNTTPWWVGIVAGALYFYGPYYRFLVGDGAFVQMGFYAAYPLMVHACLGLTQLGQVKPSRYFKDTITLLAAVLVGQAGFLYYYYITGVGSLILISLVYLLINRRDRRGFTLGLAGLVGGLLIAQLSLAPILAHDVSAGPTLAQSNTTSPNLLTLFLERTKHTTYFYELTQDFWQAKTPFIAPQPNVPTYLTTPITGIAFLAALLTLLLVGARRPETSKTLGVAAPFLAAYLFTVALAAGPQPPFGPIVLHAYQTLWFARAITESFTSLNFITQLALSTLLALALTKAKKQKHAQRKIGLAATTIILLASTTTLVAPYAAGAPLPLTQVAATMGGQTQLFKVTPRIQIPEYFKQLVAYTNSLPPHGAVLLLPISGNLRTTTWYIGVDALASTLNKPVVGGGYLATPQTQTLIDILTLWQDGANINIHPLLERMGVGYIIVEGDAAKPPTYIGQQPFNTTQIEARLNTTPGVNLTARFGPDLLYTVSWANQQEYWGPNTTYPYGITTYTQVVEASPQPWSPYPIIYIPTPQSLTGNKTQCTFTGGHIQIGVQGGYGDCEFQANITSNNTLYVTIGYQATPDINVGAQLTQTGGTTVAGLIVAKGTVTLANTTQNYTVMAFPPGAYTGLQLYAAGVGGIGAQARFGWVYVAGAATPQELAGYNPAGNTLYVTPPGGGSAQPTTLLDATANPVIQSWRCDAYGCTLSVTATQPFFLVYYTQYSPAYRLYVNGTPVQTHYLAYGSFNAWPINTEGRLELRIVYADPLLTFELMELAAWILTTALYLVFLKLRR